MEHGRQCKSPTSELKKAASGFGKYGPMPKSGTVFPQITAIGLLNAEAICIMPVSGVNTARAFLSNMADSPMVVFPHMLMLRSAKKP